MTQPSVAIIVLNWNGREDTLACLASLAQLDYPNYEVIVVDNGSTDDSISAIKLAFPNVTVLETGQNLGYVGGNNVGLEYAAAADAQYALLLNNDTEADPDFLNQLVQAAESDPQVGIVGPTIYYFEQPETIWSAGGIVDWRRGNTQMAGLNQIDRGQFGQAPRSVDFVTGCALLIKMCVVKQIGALDPRFFAYYEEAEWCLRSRQAGYQVMRAPQAKIWHKISIEQRAQSPLVHYYMTRNRLLFLRLAGFGWRAWFHALFVEDLRTLISWSIKPKWRRKRATRNAMLQALVDATTGRWGKRR